MDWSNPTQSMVCIYGTSGLNDSAARPILLLLHPGTDTQKFLIAKELRTYPWSQFIDTSAPMPGDIYPAADGPPLPANGILELKHHTLMCFVA